MEPKCLSLCCEHNVFLHMQIILIYMNLLLCHCAEMGHGDHFDSSAICPPNFNHLGNTRGQMLPWRRTNVTEPPWCSQSLPVQLPVQNYVGRCLSVLRLPEGTKCEVQVFTFLFSRIISKWRACDVVKL